MAIIEWSKVLLAIFIMIIDVLILKLIEKKTNIDGELKRKLFHMSMGIIVLTFPFIFKNRQSVVVLGSACILAFIIMKNTNLKKTIGSVLYSVNRESSGEIFFAISVILIFYWSKGDKILYSIPILILTFADSVAALIGKSYGKKDLAELNEDSKSIEGSFMFFMTAFILTLVPLLLFTNVGREETLIISAIIGFNVSLIEMISHSGNDNLLIPLTTYAFLVTHIGLDASSLRTDLIILFVIFGLVTIANRVKAWSKLALVEALVIGYLTISLYGIYAIIPPLILFLTCMRFPKIKENEKNNIYDARIIETNVIAGISVCGIATVLNLKKELFMVYSLCFCMHLAVNTFVRLKYYFNYSNIKSVIVSFFKALLFIFIPSLIIERVYFLVFQKWYEIALEVLLLFLSTIIICLKKKNVEKEEVNMENAYLHLKIVVYLTSIMLLFEFFIMNILKL